MCVYVYTYILAVSRAPPVLRNPVGEEAAHQVLGSGFRVGLEGFGIQGFRVATAGHCSSFHPEGWAIKVAEEMGSLANLPWVGMFFITSSWTLSVPLICLGISCCPVSSSLRHPDSVLLVQVGGLGLGVFEK